MITHQHLRLPGKIDPSSVASNVSGYIRPADWIQLPTVTASDQKFVGLHTVYNNDSNFVAFQCAGSVTIDWGDGGATENVAANTSAFRNLSYASYGNLSSRGYRQALITITPQAGQNLTKVDLFIKHNQAGLASGYSTGWLDIRMAGSNMSTLTIGSVSTTVTHSMLEQFEFVGTNAITTFNAKFANCRSLMSIVSLYITTATNFSNMFSGCSSLTTIPRINTSSGTDFTSMFNNCSSLTAIPLLSTASGTNFTSMFSGCTSLMTIPLLNTASGTNFNTMFSGCTSLTTIPLLNTASSVTFSSMFSGCTSLTTIPLLNTSSGTIFTNTFNGCVSLVTIPLINTVSGTSFSSMFSGCSALVSVPLLDLSSATSVSSMFVNCASLRVGALSGTKVSINYSNCILSATELNAIYTNLAVVVGQTITVSGNYGIAGDDPTIATAKGWVVTGS